LGQARKSSQAGLTAGGLVGVVVAALFLFIIPAAAYFYMEKQMEVGAHFDSWIGAGLQEQIRAEHMREETDAFHRNVTKKNPDHIPHQLKHTINTKAPTGNLARFKWHLPNQVPSQSSQTHPNHRASNLHPRHLPHTQDDYVAPHPAHPNPSNTISGNGNYSGDTMKGDQRLEPKKPKTRPAGSADKTTTNIAIDSAGIGNGNGGGPPNPQARLRGRLAAILGNGSA